MSSRTRIEQVLLLLVELHFEPNNVICGRIDVLYFINQDPQLVVGGKGCLSIIFFLLQGEGQWGAETVRMLHQLSNK